MDEAVEALREDDVLAPLIAEHGRLTLDDGDEGYTPFQRLVVAILNQQLSTEAAATIRDRVFDAITVTPQGVLDADEDVLREAGVSRQKIGYLQDAGETFQEEDLGRERFAAMDDAAVIDTLTAIRGVGTWTAKIYCMFVLHREDVFPVEDLGIRRGMRTLFDPEMDREAMRERAEAWRPYRSIAALYVWKAA